MIRPTPFLDPRGKPTSGMMQIIGGPRDGEEWSIHTVAPQHSGGRYEIADQMGWAFVWVPNKERGQS